MVHRPPAMSQACNTEPCPPRYVPCHLVLLGHTVSGRTAPTENTCVQRPHPSRSARPTSEHPLLCSAQAPATFLLRRADAAVLSRVPFSLTLLLCIPHEWTQSGKTWRSAGLFSFSSPSSPNATWWSTGELALVHSRCSAHIPRMTERSPVCYLELTAGCCQLPCPLTFLGLFVPRPPPSPRHCASAKALHTSVFCSSVFLTELPRYEQ